MMIPTPLASASEPKATMSCGVRCAETIRTSLATPNSSSTSAAGCMIARSDFEPITMATRTDVPGPEVGSSLMG